ncbi:MAG TPA: arginine--tRNA ligase [Gaiellaceae bacterium]|nr:arginine--tRNA ligase [Gaiellaceae bacterium]
MSAQAVERLQAKISAAVGTEVELERPKDASHGDFATNVALRTAKEARRPPRELAAELAARIGEVDEVDSTDVAGPGFINLRLADSFFVGALGEVGESYGGGWAADAPEKVQVEMVSANPTGPLLVSHARNGAYGDSVARLLAFGGHAVEREYYYNDAGAQIDRFRASVDALRRGEPVPEDGYHGDYVRDLAAQAGDPLPRMLTSIEGTLERFRVHFDSWALQSELEQRLPEFMPRLDTYEKDGAVWARSSAYGDEQDWVIIRSADKGGTPTYRAADIVYLTDKLDRGFDKAMYVLGADHHATAGWYAAIARMLGYDESRVEVLLYQFVHLTSGNEAAKVSKRAGNVVFLDELIDQVGVDAARWYLINRGPDQTIEIDLDLAAEKSNKNPVYYVQYAHARIAAILRNAGGSGEFVSSRHTLANEERELIKRLTDFPVTVREAADRRGPQLIPAYAIRLADDFHRFYHECRVLGSPEEAFRLGLCRAAQGVIARCLDLVGVEAPDRM